MKIKNSEEILNTGVMGDTHVWMREIAAQIARLNETLTVLNANIRFKELKAEVNLYESVAEREDRA